MTYECCFVFTKKQLFISPPCSLFTLSGPPESSPVCCNACSIMFMVPLSLSQVHLLTDTFLEKIFKLRFSFRFRGTFSILGIGSHNDPRKPDVPSHELVQAYPSIFHTTSRIIYRTGIVMYRHFPLLMALEFH